MLFRSPAAPADADSAPIPSLGGDAARLEQQFDAALAARDADGAVKAVLELDAAIVQWSRDTLQGDEMDRARAALRSMIVRLGEAATGGVRDPRAVLGPVVEAALAARVTARESKAYDVSDAIRDNLIEAGIEVRVKRPEVGEPEVLLTNRFTNRIASLLIATDTGTFAAEGIDPGESVTAIGVANSSDPFDRLQKSVDAGLSDTHFILTNHYGSPTDAYGYGVRQYNPFATTLSRLRRHAKDDAWPVPGTYIAFLDGFDEVEPPCENIMLESDLNVIFGKW